MDILKLKTTEEVKFKDLKDSIDKLDLKIMGEEDIYNIIDVIKQDKRKNVFSLGCKLEKNYEKYIKEINRVKKLYDFDKSFGKNLVIAGVDEVGRGPLAGPIVAASVILDLNVDYTDMMLYINDSKALNEKKREELSDIIKEKALSYSIKLCTNEEIDNEGIAYCNNKIFKDACESLKIKPDLVLSDGYLIKEFNINNKSVIKGDANSASIACASIIAKVYRDNLMKEYHEKYPEYDFFNNAGYGTKKHIEAIKQNGITPIHRKSFLRNIDYID